MDKKTIEERRKRYEAYKTDKKIVRAFPNAYDKETTIKLLQNMYEYLKRYHNDLPKLTANRIRTPLKKCKMSSDAHCHEEKKICFKVSILTKRKSVTNLLGGKIWSIHEGNFMLGELLTHEIAHFRVKGSHNKRFYKRQRQLFNTLINGIISGELYETL